MHCLLQKAVLFLFIVAVFACSVFPGEPDKPTSNISPEPKTQDRLKLNFSFGLALLQGNTESLLINSDLNFNWMIMEEKTIEVFAAKDDKNAEDSGVGKDVISKEIYRTKSEIRFSSLFYYLVVGDEQRANKSEIQLTFYYHFPKFFSFFIYTKPSYNQLQELDYRIENGLGVKYNIFQDTDAEGTRDEISISAGLVYEIFKYEIEEQNQVSRISIRPKIEWAVSDSVNLAIQLFWQPNIEDFSDYRLLLRSALEFKISKSISFLFKVDGEYNSIVPVGIENRDFIMSNSMKITL
jgi:hypothetical protein